VGLGSTLAAARANAEKAAEKVTWQGMQRRHDIAARLPAAADPKAVAASPAPISAAGWEKGKPA
jgi:hypothetical protein